MGVCGGLDTNPLNHDFATTISLAELSDEVLGEGGAQAAHANCSVKTTSMFVDLFEGGESFVRRRILAAVSVAISLPPAVHRGPLPPGSASGAV